ncbi:MAG: NAD(P)/FAD-dependent oxidoreductase [Ardenticatenaceae bacterium]
MNQSYDIIIVGGGVMGCATAYYLLKADDTLKIAMIEKDPSYMYSSTVRCDGNVRIQFNIKENIEISQYGMKRFANFGEEMAVGDKKPDLTTRKQGNLFLAADEAGRQQALQGLRLQQSMGCNVEWISADEIANAYPTYATQGCVGGTLGHDDGFIDPHTVLMGYKNKVLSMGVEYIHAEVGEVLADQGQVTGVRLATGEVLASGMVLNAAGAWAGKLAETVGVDIPVKPYKREIYMIKTTLNPQVVLPGIFLPTGVYLFHENKGNFVIGKSFPDDPITFEFGADKERFIERLWPMLFEYLPAFEQLKVVKAWAGLYAVNTMDGNSILGEWPELRGFYLINGFSGHGYQQCHGVGRYLAECMLDLPHALDLSIFSPKRILTNSPVFENPNRII